MKIWLGVIIALLVSELAFAAVEKYYVGKVEISKQDFDEIDSTLIRSKETFSRGDTVITAIEPIIFARIDSVSVKGHVSVVMRSQEEIDRLSAFLNLRRTESAVLAAGDKLPDFTLYQYATPNSAPLSYEEAFRGKVLLVNFWATWCGPCLEELKPQYLMAVVDQFKDYDNFKFVPVSVNHDEKELTDFFESERGLMMGWLREATLWDKNGEFEKSLSTGGIPLTLLVDSNGVIRLNESGAFINEEQLSKLKEKIAELLADQH